jgi:SAM-dependent methyltransferase
MTKPRIEGYYKYSSEKLVASKILQSALGSKTYESVLDVGCGDGTLTQFLSEKTGKLHLCEISSFYKEKLESRFPQAHIEIDDIWNISLKRYDLIHFSQGLYYHDKQKWIALIDHLMKSLLPDGELILVMNCDVGDWWEAVKSVWQTRPGSLKFHYWQISDFINQLRLKYEIGEHQFSYGVTFTDTQERDRFIVGACVPLHPGEIEATGLLNQFISQLSSDLLSLEYQSVLISITQPVARSNGFIERSVSTPS